MKKTTHTPRKTARKVTPARKTARKTNQQPYNTGMLIKDAWALVGGLGKASKMPGWCYGLSAWDCKTGSKLALIPGSACHKCYARQKGKNYQFPCVIAAHARRLASLDDPRWTEAMITLIRRKCKKVPFFRWHDSGDLQHIPHLLLIIAVAFACPDVHFWLPTQEHILLKYARRHGFDWPTNLVVRESATKLNIQEKFGQGPISSQTTTGIIPEGAYECPAPKQGNACGTCRACWSPSVLWTLYHFHE
jgi:hypothetical protein